MLKLAVVGRDVSRSASPEMHTFLLGEMGTDCRYDRRSVPPEGFGRCAEELLGEYDGLNVTIPFKQSILPHLRALSAEAAACGAVNTVVCARREGHNTDGFGFSLMLENAGVAVAGRRVLVLGAGGAARSCIRALGQRGAAVSVFSRTFARVSALFDDLGCFSPLKTLPDAPFDLIVNCTGVGMHETVGVSPVPEETIKRCGGAVDLIYEPAESEFLRLARKNGLFALGGEAMLFYQAYAADCIFLNRQTDAAEAKALFARYRKEEK